MAIHAAMVDRMDREIGKIVEQLKAMDALDNTAIFFLSDNGASAEIMVRGDGHDRQAPMGSAASYLCLGPGWSSCANTPFRRHKTWVHEGGISTPLIVHWPSGFQARNDYVQLPLPHVIDLVPTIADITGVDIRSLNEARGAPKLPGQSLVPVLGADQGVRSSFVVVARGESSSSSRLMETGGCQSEPWELYDLGNDRAESKNLAEAHPDLAKELAEQWEGMTREIQQTHQHGVPVKELVLPAKLLHSKGVRRSFFGRKIS